MLNAQWLESFAVLCETGHFTRAAQRLNMTQPGVSQQLRKLEAQVGQPLLTRQNKGFTLTPAGEEVLALAQARRAEERRLREAIRADDPAAGEVAVASSGSFAMALQPAFWPLLREAPGLALRLEAAPQRAVLDGVAEGRFDLGVVDHAPGDPRLAAERIGRETLCLLLPATAGHETPGFANLQARGFIAHPDGWLYAEELFPANFPDEFRGAEQLAVRAFVNQIGQIPAPVAHGVGYTLLPLSGVEAFSGRDRITIARLPVPRHRELWLLRRRGRVSPARVERVADLVAQVAARLQPRAG
ncbi:LysR family transcriptional regulator [Limimaricola hongkongensis]|uniref:Transcriptional regulator, LysR family n=1 Tax=Limimaricola hongkongensis DSM 17492 TaxID=1122180 RepID=A0A017HD00_9RHOB|nr:LysR family transcriptional regulator [Limimaricola hongkongensis]EYD71654.1 Transcriptional regulator, LysR family [Limimaricola hongkongensis DSM 17492]